MFKKSLLGAALSIALLQPTVNASPIEILNNQNNPLSESSQEISKYENIINQLKNQLNEKIDFNNILEKKLNDAMALSKSASSDKITEEQATSLNNLIVKLNQSVQENKSENNILSNKIKVLEQFLENYKKHIVNEKNEIIIQKDNVEKLKPESKIETEVLKDEDQAKQKEIDNAVQNLDKPVEYKPASEIVKKELSIEDQKKQKDIENAINSKVEELKPETEITKKELSPEESKKIKIEEDKKNGVKEISPDQLNNIQKEESRKNEQLLKQAKEEDKKINKAKEIEKPNQVSEPIEEKTFSEMFMEKLDNLIIWFKKLFGLIDEPVVVPNPEKLTVAPTKNFESEKKSETINVEKPSVKVTEEKSEPAKEIPKATELNKNETNKVYNSFESKAVEHIISTDNAEPPKDKVEQQNNDNFNKELESFINEENKNTEIQGNKTPQDVQSKDREIKINDDKNNESIIIKVDKPDSDIKKTSFNEEQNIKNLNDISKPLDKVVNYEVKKGDNLSKIIKKHYSLKTNKDIVEKVKEISDLNNIESKNLIHIGDIIKLP